MKKLLFFISMLVLVLTAIDINAQTIVRKDSWSNYNPVLIFTGTDVAAADTSTYFRLPSDATNGIFYIVTDTVTTSDTLKSIYIQDSPDATNWTNSGLSFSNITASGITRVTSTLLGRYVRFVCNVAGSSVKIDFKVWLVLKE